MRRGLSVSPGFSPARCLKSPACSIWPPEPAPISAIWRHALDVPVSAGCLPTMIQVLLDAVAGEMTWWEQRSPALSRECEWECRQIDLVRDLGSLDPAGFDGIVSTALFDLVSADWLQQIRQMAGAGAPARPVHPQRRWPAGLDAGRSGRRRDAGLDRSSSGDRQGLRPRPRPPCPDLLAEMLEANGFDVFTGESDWHIGPDDAAMHRALIEGYRTAALEIAPASAADAHRRLGKVPAGSIRTGRTDGPGRTCRYFRTSALKVFDSISSSTVSSGSALPRWRNW